MTDCNVHKYQNGNLLVLNNKELLNDFSSQKMLNDITKGVNWTPNSSNTLNRTIVISGSVYSLNFILNVCTCYPVITNGNFVEQMNNLINYLEMTIQSLGISVNIANVIKFKLYFYTPQNVQLEGSGYATQETLRVFGKTNGTFTTKTIFGENLPVSGYEWIYKFYFSPEFKLLKKKPQIGMFGVGTTTQPNIFGTQASMFGATTTTTEPSMFGAGGTTTQPSIFGAQPITQPNMFGATTTTQPSMFGTQPTTQPSMFGTQPTTQPSMFGTQPTTQPSMFGTQPTTQPNMFGAITSTQPSMFGTQPTTQQPYGFFGTGNGIQATNAFGVKNTTQPFNFNNPANKTTQPNYFGKK